MNQRRTKELPKNYETQKVLFVKIAISFISLIPCLIPPRDNRENSERRAHQLPMTKKALFLISVPKKVDSNPKNVYYISKIVYLEHFALILECDTSCPLCPFVPNHIRVFFAITSKL